MRDCRGGVFRVCFISAVFSLLFRIFSEGKTSVGRKSCLSAFLVSQSGFIVPGVWEAVGCWSWRAQSS